MPLNSSSGRKMSFNTTCRLLILGLCALLLAARELPARAEADSPAETAQVLLLYDGRNPGTSREDVERFCRMMTSLGKSLAFGDVRDFENNLSDYEYVICCRLEEIGAAEMAAIREYPGNLLILGSRFLARYLRETGRSDLILREGTLDRGVLRYQFSTEEIFEEIVEVEDAALFQTDGGDRGTVSVNGERYPFWSSVAGVRYTPVTSLAPELAQAALMREISDWMWPWLDAPPAYGQYLVLDEIYPFMDPELLLAQIDALLADRVPFVLSAMPIYENTSYPAMAQFCQVLRYAQKNGGFILIHAPIIQSVERNTEEMFQILTDGLQAYVDNGVYPLGIEVPMSWTYDEYYLELLRRYRTVFVFDDEADSGFDPSGAGYNRLHYNQHQLVMPAIPLDRPGVPHLTCYPSAVYLKSYAADAARIHDVVSVMKGLRVPFGDLWKLDHAVWANNLSEIYEGGLLRVNGEPVELTYAPVEFDENYDYNRDIIQRITVSIQEQNRLLTGAAAVIVLIFSAFIFYLRRANRRSFFYDREPEDAPRGGSS